jgi:hypothetical protein
MTGLREWPPDMRRWAVPEKSPEPDEPSAAYDAYWSATEPHLDSPTPADPEPESQPVDTYAAFRAAADE